MTPSNDFTALSYAYVYAQNVGGNLARSYLNAVVRNDVPWLENLVKNNPHLDRTARHNLANTTLQLDDGSTVHPASHAAYMRRYNLLSFLLSEGALPDIALATAINIGDLKATGIALSYKGDANIPTLDRPLLSLAAIQMRPDLCQMLINSQADPNGYSGGISSQTAAYDCLVSYLTSCKRILQVGQKVPGQLTRKMILTFNTLMRAGCNPYQKPVSNEHCSAADIANIIRPTEPGPFNAIRARY